MSRPRLTWETLHLFATDQDIGEVVLGPERKNEFHGLATLREIDGMPKISTFWGGRYKWSVKAFLDADQGLAAVTPARENGVKGKWNEKKDRKALA